MKTTVYLVRHAESEARTRGIVQGAGLHIPLTAEGRAQAERLAERLREVRIDRMYASTALRARETAAAIRGVHPDVPYEELAALGERSKGELEGMAYADAAARYPEIHAAWNRGEDPRPPGGEDFVDVQRRTAPILERHVRAAGEATLLYVIHGNVIRTLLGHMLGVPASDCARIAQDHCAVNIGVFDHGRGSWRVECVNRTP